MDIRNLELISIRPFDNHGRDMATAMSSLVTRARIAGRLRSAGVGRDHHRSYKTKWRVVE